MQKDIHNFQKDPSQVEGAPLVDKETAHNIGIAMVGAASEDVKERTRRREEDQAAQLAKPMQEGSVTEVPDFK